eukprot:scaffold46738_cov19-Tisochrysis_lutea.AAC.2
MGELVGALALVQCDMHACCTVKPAVSLCFTLAWLVTAEMTRRPAPGLQTMKAQKHLWTTAVNRPHLAMSR